MFDIIRKDWCGATDLTIILYMLTTMATGFVIAMLVGLSREFFKTYEDGQLDALNGKAKFYLKEYPSGERHWVEREKGMVLPEDHFIEQSKTINP